MFNVRFTFLSCLLGLLIGMSMGYVSIQMKQGTNGVAVGYWGPYAVCDTSGGTSFVNAFSVRSDGASSSLLEADSKIDKVGLTGITFICDNGAQITSDIASGGSIYPTRRCGGTLPLITGFQMNVNPAQSGDALGVEDFRVICYDGSMVEGLLGTVTPAPAIALEELLRHADEDDEEIEEAVRQKFHPRRVEKAKTVQLGKINNAYWGTATLCTTGLFACGLQTRIDTSSSNRRGLTDLYMYCCN